MVYRRFPGGFPNARVSIYLEENRLPYLSSKTVVRPSPIRGMGSSPHTPRCSREALALRAIGKYKEEI
jgi:hypothetical protein